MSYIQLTRNSFALVDTDDFCTLNVFKWHCSNSGYAVRTPWPLQKPKHLLMHRIIMNCPKGKQVDHINGNRLDNRKSNLRIVDEIYNHFNIAKRKTNKSGYKGVDWRPTRNKWRVRIVANKKSYALGHYSNLEDAIKAYEEGSKKYHGEFARKTNGKT